MSAADLDLTLKAEEILAEELAGYAGRWVAVRDHRVVASADSPGGFSAVSIPKDSTASSKSPRTRKPAASSEFAYAALGHGAGRTVSLTASFGPVGVPVLGREDFFAEFLVEINHPKRIVILTPH